MIQLKQWPMRSFAPDLDPISPGVLVASNNLYPTLKGVATLPALVPLTGPLDPSWGTPNVAYVAVSTNGEQVLLVGTTKGIAYLATTGAWVFQNFSPPLPPTQAWQFTVYTNPANPGNPSNRIIATGGGFGTWQALFTDIIALNPTPFTGIATAPTGMLVAASDVSLLLVELLHKTKWWSTLNETIWTPAVETETVTASLTTTPGTIIAIAPLRGGMVFYKLNSTYFASFTVSIDLLGATPRKR